jgi:hypothetical protein
MQARNNETPVRLAKIIDKSISRWPLLAGVLLADFGLLLIAFAGLDARKARVQYLLYLGGGILCFGYFRARHRSQAKLFEFIDFVP